LLSANIEPPQDAAAVRDAACSPEVIAKLEIIRRICNQHMTHVDIHAVFYRDGLCELHDALAHRVLPSNESMGLLSLTRVLDAACRVAQRSGKLDVQRQTAPDRTLLAIPIENADGPRSAIGISIAGDFSKSILEWLGTAIEALYSSEVSKLRQENLEREVTETTAVIDLIENAMEAGDVRNACQRLVAKLQTVVPTSRIAIGFRPDSQKTCRLVAISGHASFDRHSPLSISMEAMMSEIMEHGRPIAWSLSDDDSTHASAARIASHLGSECQHIVGIPLSGREGTCKAVLVLLDKETDTECLRRSAFLEAAAPSIACVLNAAERNEKSYATRALRSLRDSWIGRGKLAIGSLLCVIGLGLCVPTTFKVTCPSLVEPSHRRYVAAPFDGTLERALVKPGEVVRKGERIAKMDDREIHWKRASVLADQNQAQKKRDTAQAAHSYAEQQIAQLEIDRLQIELQILDDRAANLELTSPIDGIVTSGDLARVEGAPLSAGQTMFEIAPTDRMIAEVSVADHEIAYIKDEQVVDIQFDAYPGSSWKASIQRIRPRAEIRDNLNVFIAEVELDNHDQRLRPGMKGQAKIYSDRRAYGWILFHQPFEYVAKKLTW
jgi:RND family efflux transporter MFP subunit